MPVIRFLLILLALVLMPPARADDVINYRRDDARMNAAIAKAKATLPAFDVALGRADVSQLSIKVRVPYGAARAAEYLWIVDVRRNSDGSYDGIIGNDVEKVPNLKKGSRLHAMPADVSDWMYHDAKGDHGGYTVRVMMDDMSPQERAGFALHFVD